MLKLDERIGGEIRADVFFVDGFVAGHHFFQGGGIEVGILPYTAL